MSEQEKIENIIIPSQPLGKWRNDDGVMLRILQYIELEDFSLHKLFIPLVDYKALQIKSFTSTSTELKVINLTISTDDEDRLIVKEVEEVGQLTYDITN